MTHKIPEEAYESILAHVLGNLYDLENQLKALPDQLNFVSVQIQERHETELRKKSSEVLKYYIEQTKKHIEHQLTGAIKGQIEDLKKASAAGWKNVRTLLYFVLASTLTLNSLMAYALFFSK